MSRSEPDFRGKGFWNLSRRDSLREVGPASDRARLRMDLEETISVFTISWVAKGVDEDVVGDCTGS
jgi:hypothetical protein